MGSKQVLIGAAALAAVCAGAGPAGAANIILNNLGGVAPGTKAYEGFTTAANFWGSVIANPITIRLDVGFGHLGPSILGQTSAKSTYWATQDVEAALAAGQSSSLDAVAVSHLPTLTPSPAFGGLGGVGAITPGYVDPAAKTGVDTSKQVFDNDGTFNNVAVHVANADAKALGLPVDPTASDGSVVFSSDFKFDFNPTDGVSSNAIDFVGVAIHEIGHALGFDSGVDIYDLIGEPKGPLVPGHSDVCGVPCEAYPVEDDAFATPLDLFRYSANPNGLGGAGPQLTWVPGVESYFSVDGGATSLAAFSTGAFNGDGWQASHWKRKLPGQPAIGIMDPAVSYGQMDVITPIDFDAFDAIGYNFKFGDRLPRLTTAEIAKTYHIAPVPEPASWAMLLMGFFGLGAVIRQRKGRSLAA